jgi:hypothetical protein
MKKFVFAIALITGIFLFGTVQSANAQRSGSMEWRGTVDDSIQIVIRNRSARIRHMSGRYINDARFSFNGAAPRGNANVRVDKRDGRGSVFIVQRPNRRNNYTTIVQINDPKGGTDRYRFNLYWD